MKILLKLILLIFIPTYAIATISQDYSEDPLFDTLLLSQPIVVLAAPARHVKTVEHHFDPVETDVDTHTETAHSQVIEYYQFKAIEVLAGKLPKSFIIRSVVDQKSGLTPEAIASGKELIMVLAPDYGADADGKPRETFLISHRAVYPVSDGAIEVPTQSGTEQWPLQKIRDALIANVKQQAKRLDSSPEPADARLNGVISGEDVLDAEPEAEPKEAPKTRPHAAKSAEMLANIKPVISDAPTDIDKEKPDDKSSNLIYWIIGLLILFVIVYGYKRNTSS